MKRIREAIRAIIQDDALYKRKDLPGDVDDPDDECGCGCEDCAGDSDFVTPKYALYTMIGDAISLYDSMEDEAFEEDEINDTIVRIAEDFRSIVR